MTLIIVQVFAVVTDGIVGVSDITSWVNLAAPSHARRRPVARGARDRRLLERARRCYLTARNRDGLAALAGAAGADSALLRARCFLRLAEPASALQALHGFDATAVSGASYAEHRILCGLALAVQGKYDASAAAYAEADRCTSTLGGKAVLELALCRAQAALARQQLAEADCIAADALCVRPVPGDTFHGSEAMLRTQLFLVRAAVAVSRDDGAAHAGTLEKAWSEQAAAYPDERDEWVRAAVLAECAQVVSAGALGEGEAFAAHAAATVWTAETARAHWTVEGALGWDAALRGSTTSALGHFRNAADVAPSPLCCLSSMLDRAELAEEMRQHVIAEEELIRAYALARSIDWFRANEDELAILLGVVAACSREDVAIARGWMRLYDEARRGGDRPAGPRARRVEAVEHEARASIAAASGSLDAAAGLLHEAVIAWDAAGQRWRAARAALALARLTRAPDDCAAVAGRTKAFPKSWLERGSRRLKQHVPG
jgi:tetratricopeptide (TPR) repeat protein